MSYSELIKNYTGQAIYQIVVIGKVHTKFFKTQNNLKVIHTKSNGRILSTLTGEIMDQAALNGLLNLLYDYEHTVISVVKIDE